MPSTDFHANRSPAIHCLPFRLQCCLREEPDHLAKGVIVPRDSSASENTDLRAQNAVNIPEEANKNHAFEKNVFSL